MERRSQKNIPITGAVEFHRSAAGAVIDRLLNAFGIETALVRVGEQAVRSREARLEPGAGRRNARFGDGPSILRNKSSG